MRFVSKRDHKKVFHVISMQSEEGEQIMRKHGFDAKNANTLLVIKSNQAFVKSNAVFEIIKSFPWYWQVMFIFKLVPLTWRDGLYDVVSRNRYVWFGKRR